MFDFNRLLMQVASFFTLLKANHLNHHHHDAWAWAPPHHGNYGSLRSRHIEKKNFCRFYKKVTIGGLVLGANCQSRAKTKTLQINNHTESVNYLHINKKVVVLS